MKKRATLFNIFPSVEEKSFYFQAGQVTLIFQMRSRLKSERYAWFEFIIVRCN